jgi:two-component system, response regulator FlrC
MGASAPVTTHLRPGQGAEAFVAAQGAAAPVARDAGAQAVGLVAEDPVTRQVLDRLARVAPSSATVLLLGESGTGKELLARYLHQCSGRRQGPFVALNCAAVPDTLVESILFGHERGAFTGAHRSQPGKFEQSHGGTLFLDEVGELPLAAQAKLLRVLQERTVERLGDIGSRGVDFRLVAATNVDLDRAVAEGRFREDLYYRLAVLPTRVPALRERPLDVPALVSHFLARYAKEFGLRRPEVGAECLHALQCHPWPGNVRELENVVQRALLLSAGLPLLDLEHLELPAAGAGGVRAAPPATPQASGVPSSAASSAAAPTARPPWQSAPAPLNVREVEREHILGVLRQVGGNRRSAVALLGISERALRYKLNAYRCEGHLVDEPGRAHPASPDHSMHRDAP